MVLGIFNCKQTCEGLLAGNTNDLSAVKFLHWPDRRKLELRNTNVKLV